MENFRWLAGVVAAHSGRKVVGRTRLQKEVMLLQRLGMPSRYRYTLHFHGPYSDGVQSDVVLLQSLGLVREEAYESASGSSYYVIEAGADADLPEIDPFRNSIGELEREEIVTLELAATYDAFRELGSDHSVALIRLRNKKGAKCDGGNQERALDLLRRLKLPAD